MLHLLGSAGVESTAHVRIVQPLALGLLSRGYVVHTWFLGGGGPLVDECAEAGMRPQVIGWTAGLRDVAGAARLFRAVRSTPFAIVHQHFGGRSVRQVVRAATSAKVVVHVHGRVSEDDPRRLLRVRLADADAVLATSAAVARAVDAKCVRVVHPGVPTAAALRSRTAQGGPVVGAAGRLVPVKGFHDLLRAFAAVSEEVDGVRLEIAGSGPQQQHLEEVARRLRIGDAVSFLGWRRDLSHVLGSWDVFAQASLEEGFGIAALEAMAAGLPVVATAVGGVPELVVDGETGFLVPPQDVDGFAKRLRELVVDPTARRTMGGAAQARARAQFGLERMVAAVADVYDDLLQRRRGTSTGASQ